MPLSTIFQLYWLRKPELPDKTTDMPQVTDELDHIMLNHVNISCPVEVKQNYNTHVFDIQCILSEPNVTLCTLKS
jgi:hypothetical protein